MCCQHHIKCAHYDGLVLVLTTDRYMPGGLRVAICDASQPVPCEAGGNSFRILGWDSGDESKLFYQGFVSAEAEAAFEAAERELLAVNYG